MNSHPEQRWVRRARHGLVRATGHLGAHAVARRLTRAFPRILMYHRFSRRPSWRTTDVATFEMHLRCLQQHWRIVTLDAVVDRYRASGRFDTDEVVVTIDDAYADFHALALPILERLNVPATLYVPTDFVDGQEWLWPDRLLWLIRSTERPVVEFGAPGRLSLATLSQRRMAWNSLADVLLEMSNTDRRAAFIELESRLGVNSPPVPTDDYRPMTWDQVRDAARRGVTIGSQATAHVPMVREIALRQLELAAHSKQRLEAQLGATVRHFSYPHGRMRDFDRQSIDAVRAAGFDSSVAAEPRVPRGCERLLTLPRMSPPVAIHDLPATMSGLAYLREWAGAGSQ